MRLRPHFDAGIIVADVIWLLLTALLVLAARLSGAPLFSPLLPGDPAFHALWRAVSVGLVVITCVWLVNTTATAFSEHS